MKRSPLARRSPLKPASRLTSKTKITARKRLPPVSDRRRILNDERRDVLLVVRARVYCEACPVLLAAGILVDPACRVPHHGRDGHEVWTRGRGGSIVDPSNIMFVCRPAHSWIGDHPAEARRLGLVASAPPVC